MVKPIFNNKKKEKENEKEKSEEKQEENNTEFLSKKRTEPDTPMPDIDMVKLKKKVNEIMYSICTEEYNTDKDFEYESMSKNYLLNEFTSNCLNYINKIILDAPKNSLKKYQGIFELNKIFISIVKELLMNEFELLLLSFSFEESFDFSFFLFIKIGFTINKIKLKINNNFLFYKGFFISI